MIDVESIIFSQVATTLRAEFSGIWVGSEETSSPATFPAVTIVEQDNSVLTSMRTLEIENAVMTMFEVNVFSNAIGGYKKLEAKEILTVIDSEFTRMGFTRTMCSPVDNLQDNTITRYVARYEAVIDKDFWVYSN